MGQCRDCRFWVIDLDLWGLDQDRTRRCALLSPSYDDDCDDCAVTTDRDFGCLGFAPKTEADRESEDEARALLEAKRQERERRAEEIRKQREYERQTEELRKRITLPRELGSDEVTKW